MSGHSSQPNSPGSNPSESKPSDTSQSNQPLPGASLPQITIETPCQMDWDLMTGDDQVRFCRRCKKNVFNISAMEESDALKLIESKEKICARIFRRPDDTIVTNVCPSPMPPVAAGKRFQFSTAALLVLITSSAGLCASAPWIGKKIQPILDRFTNKVVTPPTYGPEMGGMMAPTNTVPAIIGKVAAQTPNN